MIVVNSSSSFLILSMLNEVTMGDKYQLPNIMDLLQQLGCCQYLYVATEFHQIEIDEKEVEKTAFSLENGHCDFKRMASGIKMLPTHFSVEWSQFYRD